MAVTALSGQRWQGVSNASSARIPTYETDFGTGNTTGWVTTDAGSSLAIDNGNSKLTFSLNTGSLDDNIRYDLTTTDNSKWIIRFKVKFDNINGNATADQEPPMLWFGIGDTANPSGRVPSGDYLRFGWGLGDSEIKNKLQGIADGSNDDTNTNNSPISESIDDTIFYYCELQRVSATSATFKVFTGADYSTGQVGSTITNTLGSGSSITGLQYLSIYTWSDVLTGTGMTGYITDLEFYNAVDSTTTTTDEKTTVTDVPVGSEFEQTDDYKNYQYGGYPNGLGSSADGTIGGGVTTGVTGEISDCFSFGGTSSSNVNLGTDSGFNLLNGGTIAFWLNPNGMVDKRLCGKGSNSCWEILSEGGATEDKIKFRLDTGTNGGTLNNCVGTSTLNDDGTTWYHVCCVYDKDESEMLLYVNGLLETTESITGTIDTVGTALYLGANGSGTSNNFTGLIDDFGVWNTILPIGLANGTTAGSINYLYNKGTGAGGTARVCSTIPTGLLAYYNLDGSTCPNGVAGWIERGTAI